MLRKIEFIIDLGVLLGFNNIFFMRFFLRGIIFLVLVSFKKLVLVCFCNIFWLIGLLYLIILEG